MALRDLKERPNLVLFINDQQRALQHWPESWAEKNLPAMQRLQRHGLTFKSAFTSASACSPSRATLLTGTHPSQHGVLNTLQLPGDTFASGSGDPTALNQMRPTDANLARILAAAGYRVFWKGKWHLSLPRDGGDTWREVDIRYMEEAYGFAGWNPNDAGNSESKPLTLGAGAGDNDLRYTSGLKDVRDDSPPGESAIEFLRSVDATDAPFCLIVSLVNPHDIWVAPDFEEDWGYSPELGELYDLPIPENADEDLSTKPRVQRLFKEMMASGDSSPTTMLQPTNQARYVNFYAYLQTLADRHIGEMLDVMDERGLTDDTLIVRLADHGEMAMSHGLREKDFVAYDEAIRIPLIFSNPVAFPEPQETDSLAALIDIVPTLARIAGSYDQFRYVYKGVDLLPVLEDPSASVRDLVHFTTDDAAIALPSDVPSFIRAIRSSDWMYAVYFTSDGSTYDYEMYDLQSDPCQNTNLAGNADYTDQQSRLHRRLIEAMVSAQTVPPGILIQTPELEKLINSDDVNNPVWPSAEDAIEQSQTEYGAAATTES